MATKLLQREPVVDNIRQFGLFDDFFDYVDGTIWDAIGDATANAVVASDAQSGVGGVLRLTTQATDNDELYIASMECFKVATDKPLMAIARWKITAATTANQYDVVWGVMDAVAANTILDAGGIAASKHCAVLYKPDGVTSLVGYSTSSAAGTYNQSTTDATISDDTWYSQMILIEPVSSTDKRITFHHDSAGGYNWQQLKDSNGYLIRDTWSLADTSANTGELSLLIGVKAGSAEAQVLSVDYLGAWQLR